MPVRPIHYAVVGLGHIAQSAVLPAFHNAGRSAELAALVSGNPEKRRKLGDQYDVPAFGYEEYDALLASGKIDAVFIALPNAHHRDATLRAARHGVHVLCEKPMAVSEQECEDMIRACDDARVKLMIAYRLHFEEANLAAISHIREGRIGDPRIFSSDFSLQVREGNIRLRPELGGGPLFDIGIYCVNAMRYLFGSEPMEVCAFGIGGREPRFSGVEEALSAVLRFPDERLATFTCSFGAASVSTYRVVGTNGDLVLDPAYEYSVPLTMTLTAEGKTKRKRFKARDQFAPELVYFSECIRKDMRPEPDGWEGLADVRILAAIERSMASGRPLPIATFERPTRPDGTQQIKRPPIREPGLVQAEPPAAD